MACLGECDPRYKDLDYWLFQAASETRETEVDEENVEIDVTLPAASIVVDGMWLHKTPVAVEGATRWTFDSSETTSVLSNHIVKKVNVQPATTRSGRPMANYFDMSHAEDEAATAACQRRREELAEVTKKRKR